MPNPLGPSEEALFSSFHDDEEELGRSGDSTLHSSGPEDLKISVCQRQD